jgi:hypothetical protein
MHRSGLERLFHGPRRCKETLLTTEDSDARWRCCPRWHRKLTNKWNSRVFAEKHGCRVPKLYWHGTNVTKLPLSELPDAYVIRPMWGTALARNVCVMLNGHNLMNDQQYSPRELREELHETTSSHGPRRRRTPILVEEFITDREGEYTLPTEYKCYVFGEIVAAVEVNRRFLRDKWQRGTFTPDWTVIPGGIRVDYEPLDPDVSPPHCLDEMLACAGRLGKEIARHVRVDFFASEAGPVFSEMTFWVAGARGFNSFAEEFFGEQWEQAFPTI